MELRKAADTLLRCNASPLSTLLAPSSSIRWTSQRLLTSQSTSTPSSRRTFISSRRSNALRQVPTTSARPAPGGKGTGAADINKGLNELFSQNQSQRSPSLSPLSKSHISDPRKSSADILREFRRDRATLTPGRSQNSLDIDRMLPPDGGSMADLVDSVDRDSIAPAVIVQKIPMRLNPSMGRFQAVNERVDVARAFRMVETACGRNRVRADANNQRFHERPGMKRKRLKSLRWRVKFKEGFKATVNRVKQLKAQGW